MSENRPAPSATSDMPQMVPAEPAAVVETPAPAPESVVTTPAAAPAAPAAPEPQGPIAARMGQLAAQRREAEARAVRIEQKAEQLSQDLERALVALRDRQAPPVPAVNGQDTSGSRPTRDSYPDQESFEVALVDWAGNSAAAKAAAELRRSEEEAATARAEALRVAEETAAREAREAEEMERAASARASWETNKAKATEKYPDFDTVTSVDSLPITDPMGYMIVTRGEEGTELFYHLGKNPAEAARIAALSVPGQTFPAGTPRAGLPVPDAVAQAYEMGKIAGRLAALTPAAAPPASEVPLEAPTAPVPAAPVVPPVILPAPPEPISGASATAVRKDANEMSMEEYAASRRPQLLAERRPSRMN